MKSIKCFIGIPLLMLLLVSADLTNPVNSSGLDLGTKEMAHIAIVVNDIESTTRSYADVFGIEPPKIRLGNSPDYMGEPTDGKAKMAFIKLDNIMLEFFEPVGGPTAWSDYLDKHGEGVHHFGFWVEGLDGHVKNFKNMNMPVVQSGGGDWGRYRYIDASKGLGVMVELLERSNPK